MDDKHVEDMLRDAWSPEPPEGMRERVLGRAREELLRRRSVFGMGGWKLACASLSLLVIVVSNLADHARQGRLSAMMDGFTRPEVSVPVLAARDDLDDRIALSLTRSRVLNLLERGG